MDEVGIRCQWNSVLLTAASVCASVVLYRDKRREAIYQVERVLSTSTHMWSMSSDKSIMQLVFNI